MEGKKSVEKYAGMLIAAIFIRNKMWRNPESHDDSIKIGVCVIKYYLVMKRICYNKNGP